MLEKILVPTQWDVVYEGCSTPPAAAPKQEKTVVITLRFSNAFAVCPACHYQSNRIHSRYLRQPADLPLANQTCQLALHARRFFCDNPACQKRTFTEQNPTLVGFRQRRTVRQKQFLVRQAFACGATGAARLLGKSAITVSPTTLLRFLVQTPLPTFPSPRVVGVDDWAKRKGKSYGTILVNLETHQVIDLLPDREATTLANWLSNHSGIEFISRDRAGAYAEGARRGAPKARQVADRFHLVKNLVDYLKLIFERKRACLREPATLLSADPALAAQLQLQIVATASGEPRLEAATSSPQKATELPPSDGSLELVQPYATETALISHWSAQLPQGPPSSRKGEIYAQIQDLKQVMPIRAVARHLRVSRQTVRKYSKAGSVPAYTANRTPRPSILNAYKPYILARWQAGHYHRRTLLAEIRERGYMGQEALLGVYLTELNLQYPRQKHKLASKTQLQPKTQPTQLELANRLPRYFMSAKQAAFVVIKPTATLLPKEQLALNHFQAFDSELSQVIELSQEFMLMLREKKAENLAVWLGKLAQSESNELVSFAYGLRHDYQAVENGLTLEYSQGQVEGQVNRLKTLKRAMYGRASFNLLKTRMLYPG